MKQLLSFQPVKRQLNRIGSLSLYLAIQSWVKTFDLKISHYDESVNPARSEFTEPCIFVFWHEYIAVPTMIWGHSNVTLFVSQHRDADWLVHIGKHLGFDSIRGSTTRGGSAAIRACKEKMKTHSLGVTPDGPTGPRREMALGAVYLASRLQCPIVPVGFGYEKPFRLKTWDQFAIPKPGSRVRAIMGPKIHIPFKAKREVLEAYKESITADINSLTTACEESAATDKDLANWDLFKKDRKLQSMPPALEFDRPNDSLDQFDLREVAKRYELPLNSAAA